MVSLIKGHERVYKFLLSVGNVVHSDNDEESLYACCCTQGDCQRVS